MPGCDSDLSLPAALIFCQPATYPYPTTMVIATSNHNSHSNRRNHIILNHLLRMYKRDLHRREMYYLKRLPKAYTFHLELYVWSWKSKLLTNMARITNRWTGNMSYCIALPIFSSRLSLIQESRHHHCSGGAVTQQFCPLSRRSSSNESRPVIRA